MGLFGGALVLAACSSSGGGGGAASCLDGGTCPSGQVCNPSTGVCESSATGGNSGRGGSGAASGTGGVGAASGTGGIGAASGTGGVGATGGVGGTGGGGGAFIDCKPDDPSNTCQVCTEQKCCKEFEACVNGGDPCGAGGPEGQGEIYCMFACLASNPGAVSTCASQCLTPGSSTIGNATNNLFSCLDTNCFNECIP